MRLLGIPEIMLVLLLALLIFGPAKLPNMGRTLRSAITELELTAVQKILATISLIVVVVALGLLLAKRIGWLR
jgi:TatA/E family protein of Tat protein translocase